MSDHTPDDEKRHASGVHRHMTGKLYDDSAQPSAEEQARWKHLATDGTRRATGRGSPMTAPRMTMFSALEETQRRWGPLGAIVLLDEDVTNPIYAVGVIGWSGVFIDFGLGENWDDAFRHTVDDHRWRDQQ